MGIYKNSDLRKYHTIFLEIGLIASLLIFIIAMKADLPGEKKTVDFSHEKEVVNITPILRTAVENQPPPPADPVVKPSAPIDDPIIDKPTIDLNPDPKLSDPPLIDPKIKESTNTEDEIFVAVEQYPEIVGGQKALYNKLNYPARCRRAGIEGRVILSFIVNTDGSVQDIEITRGIGGGCDQAAVQALEEVIFKPGRQRGNPVRVRFSWPITFQLK